MVEVLDTKGEQSNHSHFKQTTRGLSASFEAVVNSELQFSSARNHSTHLLHESLRSILGTHVERKDLVRPEI